MELLVMQVRPLSLSQTYNLKCEAGLAISKEMVVLLERAELGDIIRIILKSLIHEIC